MSHRLEAAGAGGEVVPLAEINVTPLVDVMLVLLIIFMVTAPIMLNQVPVTLPVASPAPATATEKLAVNLDAQGRYTVQRGETAPTVVAYVELPALLRGIATAQPGSVVTVCAAPGALYDRVVDLMSIAGEAGFAKLSLCP